MTHSVCEQFLWRWNPDLGHRSPQGFCYFLAGQGEARQARLEPRQGFVGAERRAVAQLVEVQAEDLAERLGLGGRRGACPRKVHVLSRDHVS